VERGDGSDHVHRLDHLKPHAAALKVAHPLMLRAIAAAKKKNDHSLGLDRQISGKHY
jgi:hypothetical protein